MSKQNGQRGGAGLDGAPVAALLRAAADGELDAAAQRRLEAHLLEHPEDGERIEFERRLRGACARAMGDAEARGAPAALRGRVVAALEEEAEPAGRGRSPWRLWGGALPAAAAAVLLLVAGAFLWQMARIGSGESAVAGAGYMEIARFAAEEHEACELDPSRQGKFTIERLESAPEELGSILGRTPTLGDLLEAGLAFRDAGECRLPGRAPSAHVRFENEATGESVSLFVQRVGRATPQVEPETAYRVCCRGAGAGERMVYLWQSEGLNYFLVVQDPAVWECLNERRPAPCVVREVG